MNQLWPEDFPHCLGNKSLKLSGLGGTEKETRLENNHNKHEEQEPISL